MRGLPVLRLAVVVAAGVFLLVEPAYGVSSSRTATVRIVDNYDHGRIRITFDNVDQTMHNGDRTGELSVTPDAMHNDVITVRALRFHKCGIAKIGWFFHAGQRYRVRVNHFRGGTCHTSTGASVRGPAPHVDKLS